MRALRFLRPASGDLLSFITRNPYHDDLRAGRTGLVANLVRWFHVADHPWFEDLALAVHDVLELSGQHVEHLDRAVRVLAGIGVRGKGELSDRHLGADVAVVEHQLQRGAAGRAVGRPLFFRLRQCGRRRGDDERGGGRNSEYVHGFIMREPAMIRQLCGHVSSLRMLWPFLLCGMARATSAQNADCKPPTSATTASLREDPVTVCRLLSALSADSMEGRAMGTRGAHRASRFIAEQFRAAGLEPAGDSGYFQRVPLVRTERATGRSSFVLAPSFAARDTFPESRRGSDVNVIGRLPGADPRLKDSVVLVDAHFDHLG